MTRKPLIAGNWKMNLDHEEATNFFQKLSDGLEDAGINYNKTEVVVFPPFTDLRSIQVVSHDLDGAPAYGAQDLSPEANGAFTGDIPAGFLTKLGCTYVLVGHSERRTLHHETDADALAKTKVAIAAKLVTVLCVGEPLEERQAKNHVEYTLAQVKAVVAELTPEELDDVVIAYEPVWAIGTGEVATAEDAQEMAAAIRKEIANIHNEETADKMRILYGGSVKGSNADEIIGQQDVDGALVGGASLDEVDFVKIAESAPTA
ncbi:MAG: triose-phosphate isomerase [Micrococcaceae bacterium]